MFSTIWDLLPVKIKLGIGIGLLIVVLGIGGIISYQANKIDLLKTELTTCQVERKSERLIFEEERVKAKTAIDEQNAKISEYEIDAATVIEKVNKKEKALIEERVVQQQQIDKELSTDSSPNNQLRVITKIMKDFSNETN